MSVLKIYKIHPVGNHLLFRSRGRATRKSTCARRKVENNNDSKVPDLLGNPHVNPMVNPPCSRLTVRWGKLSHNRNLTLVQLFQLWCFNSRKIGKPVMINLFLAKEQNTEGIHSVFGSQ